MKMINKKNTQKAIVVASLGLLLAVLCILLKMVFDLGNIFDSELYDPATINDFSYIGSYKIDPSTILKSIDGEPSMVFLPETTVMPASNTNNEVAWTQAEYYKIAAILFEFVWKEPLNKNWSIHRISFGANCKENPVGFERATFVFNQLLFQGENFRYNARAVEIAPLDGEVFWGGGNTYPRPLFGKSQFDLDNLKITADDALSIAEKNGGKALRQSGQNRCRVGLYLEEGGWNVVYFGLVTIGRSPETYIDPYTGKVIDSTLK
jgi:hypothetical protein